MRSTPTVLPAFWRRYSSLPGFAAFGRPSLLCQVESASGAGGFRHLAGKTLCAILCAPVEIIPSGLLLAHPCIESWLLANANAIRKGLDLPSIPNVPQEPENLPAPNHDPKQNPKIILAACIGAAKNELSSAQKDKVALAMKDVASLRERCPIGFAPFADEVEQRIKPLFGDNEAQGV